MPVKTTNSGIGLVLSGGGTRGLAHIGAMRVLESLGFRPAAIAGCSMGAVIGAMVAAGKTADEMEAFIRTQKLSTVFQWPITSLGLANFTKFERAFLEFIGTRRFEGLQIPLILNATNLSTGEMVVYDRGLLWPALRASISIPGIFAPVRVHHDVLVDGGILSEHPYMLLPESIRRFILVNCSPRETLTKRDVTVMDLFRTSLNIMQNEMTQLRLAAIPSSRYLLIEPGVHGHNLLEGSKQYGALIGSGTEAAEAMRPDLERFLAPR